MNLRTKLLSGFLILAMMLFVSGAWSIYELTTLGSSFQRILSDNYQSIQAARTMIEALEREDSAVLLLLSGSWEGRSIIESADSSFQIGFNVAKNNLTVPGEQDYVHKIDSAYRAYKDLWKTPIVDTKREGDLNWYFHKVHETFIKAKFTVKELMQLNNQTMYNTASNLRSRSYRTIMPGIVAVVASLAFVMIFNFFINLYVANPIINMAKGIQGFTENRKIPDLKIETKDELSYLSSSIRDLMEQIKTNEARK